KMWCKCELILVTLCHRKGRLSRDVNYDSTTQLCPKNGLFSTPNFFWGRFFVHSREKLRLEVLERERVSAAGSAAMVEVVGNAPERGEAPAGRWGKVQ